jgi:hypothetical protein
MVLRLHGPLILSLAFLIGPAATPRMSYPAAQRRWFGPVLAFQRYSCGETRQVSRLISRLEQFRLPYSLLAGTSRGVPADCRPGLSGLRHDAAIPPATAGPSPNLTAFSSRRGEGLIVLR